MVRGWAPKTPKAFLNRRTDSGTLTGCAAGPKEVARLVGSGQKPVARLLDLAPESGQVNAHEFALPLHDLAGDEYVFDVARIHQRHNRAGHVVQREGVDPLGP